MELRKRRKRKMADFEQSEPQFLLDYMNHHRGWAVVICLVATLVS